MGDVKSLKSKTTLRPSIPNLFVCCFDVILVPSPSKLNHKTNPSKEKMVTILNGWWGVWGRGCNNLAQCVPAWCIKIMVCLRGSAQRKYAFITKPEKHKRGIVTYYSFFRKAGFRVVGLPKSDVCQWQKRLSLLAFLLGPTFYFLGTLGA